MIKPTREYKLVRGTHGRVEKDGFKRYVAGDPQADRLHLNREEAQALGDRVQLASQNANTGESESESESTEDNPSTDTDADDWGAILSGLTWQDAVTMVKAIDNLDDVHVARAAEQSGVNRKSVLDALDATEARLK